MKCDKSLAVVALAEFTGSFLFTGVSYLNGESFGTFSLQTGMKFGLTLFGCNQIFGCISGGIVNPSISLAAILLGKLEWDLGLVYIVFQFLGSLVGYFFAMSLRPKILFLGTIYGVSEPSYINDIQAVSMEFILTSVWVLCMCAIWDGRNAGFQESVPLRIGFVVVGLSTAGGIFTDASMNPARSLGPAIFASQYDSLWIYFAGPLLAAVVMPLLWKYLLSGGGGGGGGGD